MSTAPGCQFVQALLKSGLITEAAFASAMTLHRAQHGGRENYDSLPGELVQAGVITQWQLRMLLRGASRGFFLGKHKLLDRIGAGGMSVVYLAEHVALQRRVAIKVLDQKRSSNPSHLARFFRESRVTAALDHANVVRVYDFDSFGDHYYLVMEFIDGLNLQEMTDQRGPLAPELAGHYIMQAAAGLAVAHKAGLIHRDVKPANLIVNTQGVLKVTDLGLARTDGGEALKLTQDDGGMLGTVDYISPEQAIDSHHVTAYSDIYSLGCTLYFLLTGQPPYPGGSLATKLMHHQIKKAPAITSLRPDAPTRLVEICESMLAKKPGDRPSAEELHKTLRQWLQAVGSALTEEETQALATPSVARPRPAADTVATAAATTATVCTTADARPATDVRQSDLLAGAQGPSTLESSSINLAGSSVGGDGLTSRTSGVRLRMTCNNCRASVLSPVVPGGRAAPCPHCGGVLTAPSGQSPTGAPVGAVSQAFPGFGLPEQRR